MSFIRKLLVATLTVAAIASAAEKTEEKKKDTPQILLALPFTLVGGETNKITIRGLLLTNAIEARFPSAAHLIADIKSRGKAIVPGKSADSRLIHRVAGVHGEHTGRNGKHESFVCHCASPMV